MTYLDYQATTPLAPEALEAMLPWLRDGHANPHSPHRDGRRAKAAVEVARDRVAALLPRGGRVVFTSGATEALNWAIKGTSGPIATFATEHAAVLDTAVAEGERGREVTVMPVGGDGLAPRVTPAPEWGSMVPQASAHDKETLSSPRNGPRIKSGVTGGLWAGMLVNNEIGVVQPIADLAQAAHEAGALFLCDAVQGYGRVAIPDGVDLVALSAHKIYGPKGIGALWVRDGVTLAPLLHGGDQEGGRSGTLSPALCAGFGVAAALMADRAVADAGHVERLWQIATETLAGWRINGSVDRRYCGNVNVRRDGLDVGRLMSDCRDIAFSAGSACASGSGRPSHVLRAIGLSDAEARSSIRLGWGRYTSEAALIEALDRLVAAADAQRT